MVGNLETGQSADPAACGISLPAWGFGEGAEKEEGRHYRTEGREKPLLTCFVWGLTQKHQGELSLYFFSLDDAPVKPAHSAGQENLHPQLQLWLQLVHLKRKWGKSTPLCSTKVRRNLANKPWCSSVWQAEQSLLSLTVGSVPMEVPWTVMRTSKENIHILYGSDSQGILRGRTMCHHYRPTFRCQQCLRGKKREGGAAGQPCCSRTGLHFHLLPTMALGTLKTAFQHTCLD